SEQEAVFLENTTAWVPKAPVMPEASAPVLKKPVVIPRIDTSGKITIPLPFMRAYSPDLRPHDVNERDFLAFIDNLAVAQTAPVPLQLLDVAGHAVGFVPHHWAMFAGASMNMAAGVGTAAVSAFRTRHFMDKVNREYFAPRGLNASLCKNDQLAEKLGYDPSLPQVAPLNIRSGPTTIRDRRLQALEPYIAPLSFDVPLPTNQRNALDQMAAKQSERNIQKKE
ncbi:hypothetical protein K505DRAFT_206973, partial [Melanomma pulvis-pyrius CBS 109.77]